jgi:hypothetical protein
MHEPKERILLQLAQIKKKISKFHVEAECLQCHQIYECQKYDAIKSRVGHLCNDCKNIITNMKTFTQQDLVKVFYYNPTTGDLQHKLETLRCHKGSLATYPHNEGYLNVCVGGKEYLAHRIIWFMQTGQWPGHIDHENHVRNDNRWKNLTDSNSQLNQQNKSKHSNNRSGHTGVRVLPSGKYNAFIMYQYKQIPLGTYDDLNDAITARKAAELQYGFHKNHGS